MSATPAGTGKAVGSLRHIWAYGAIAAIVALFIIVPRMGGHRAPEARPRPVTTAVAVTKDVPIFLDTFGNMTPPQDVSIRAQVTGEVKEVRFTDGQDVKKGDILFLIDPSQYAADVDKAAAAVAVDTANLKLARDTLERNKQLVASKLISQQDFEKYETDLSSAESKLKLDTAALSTAKINLGYCTVSSPIDGRAGKRQIDAGNIVIANTGPVLVTIKTIDRLYVDFTIPETDLARARAAMAAGPVTVEISFEGDTDGPYKGDVVFIDNTVDNSTGTVAMRAIVDNTARKLWPGQFVSVRLILGMSTGSVLVPYEAVQIGQKGHYLFAVTDEGKVEVRPIITGNRVGDMVSVRDGVKAGERVVVTGQLGIGPGVPVVDVTGKEAPPAEHPKAGA